MKVTELLAIALGAILTNNFIFSQFLGICPFMGVSKKIDTAVGMGAAVTFVMGLASALCYPVNKLLDNLGLGFMQTVAFILVIAGLVQFVEMFLKKNIPTLYAALGVYLPLITTNCAVLGVALLNTQNSYNFVASVIYGITGGKIHRALLRTLAYLLEILAQKKNWALVQWTLLTSRAGQ